MCFLLALRSKACERCLAKSIGVLTSTLISAKARVSGGECAAYYCPLASLPEGGQCDGARCLNALSAKAFPKNT